MGKFFINKMFYSVVIFLFLLPSILTATKQLPVETNLLWEQGFIYAAPCDINKDLIDELVVIKTSFCIEPINQNLLNPIATRWVERGTFNTHNSTTGGMGNERIWGTYVNRDSLFLYDVWPQRKIFVVRGDDNAIPSGWDGGAGQVELKDINADGHLEATVSVISGTDRNPRSIFVLDWETGKLLWKFPCGPIIRAFLLRDIDGDGHQEILCGTHAVGNGNIDNGMVDWKSYVLILNSDGKIRWKRQIGTYSSEAKVQWINNQIAGTLRVLVCEKGDPAGGRKRDRIFLLDALTGTVIRKARYGQFTGGFTIIDDQKGLQMIVIGGSDDTLRMLDENLKLIRRCCANGSGVRHITHGKFTADRKNEIAVATNRGYISIYDLKFNLLSQFKIGPVINFQPIKFLNKERLLVWLEKNNGADWALLEFNNIPLLNRGIPVATVIIGTFGLLLLFAIAMVYARYQRTRDIRMVIRGLTGQGGVIELNHKGEVTNINSNAREILGLVDKKEKLTLNKLSTIKQLGPVIELAKFILSESTAPQSQETVVSLGQDKYYLVKCVRVKKGVLITFEDISAVEYMKRVTSWAPVAQKLAHGIKNPLSTILGAVEQMEVKCQENGVKKYIGYVKDEVTRLKKMSDAFMRFTKLATPALEPKNINEMIKKVIAKYETVLEGAGRKEQEGKIKVEYALDEKLPSIHLDEEGILSALSIIIENAIEAMGAREQIAEKEKQVNILRVKTLPAERLEKEESKRYVRIEISDTGSGIPEKYLDKVFDPYFSYNKPLGTGLGLTLAKKIIEDHKGFVEIHSTENVGTQVNVYLPI